MSTYHRESAESTAARNKSRVENCTRQIAERFERGDLPGFRLFGRKGGPVRFRLGEIEKMLETWRVNGPGAGGEVAPVPFQSPDPRRSLTVAPVPDRGGEDAR